MFQCSGGFVRLWRQVGGYRRAECHSTLKCTDLLELTLDTRDRIKTTTIAQLRQAAQRPHHFSVEPNTHTTSLASKPRCWFYFGRAVELGQTFLCSSQPDPLLAAFQTTPTLRAYQYGWFEMYLTAAGNTSLWFGKHERYTYAMINNFYTCGVSVQPLNTTAVSLWCRFTGRRCFCCPHNPICTVARTRCRLSFIQAEGRTGAVVWSWKKTNHDGAENKTFLGRIALSEPERTHECVSSSRSLS